ncbi:MAG: potassium-transporting ATPase subunit KdpA [Gammaproteobacteria bacterium]
MSLNAWLQIGCYLAIVLLCAKPLGWYMAQIYQGQYPQYVRFLGRVESFVYRCAGVDPHQEMTWKQYACALILFNALGLLSVFVIICLQYYLPGNPQHLSAPNISMAFNIAVSFVTNTNWQPYIGEKTLSYGTQMLALTSQNFLSAACGMSILLVLIRGIRSTKGQYIGNYWVDMVRTVLYILLPLASILALVLVSQGVIQNLKPNQMVNILQTKSMLAQQTIPMGPVASQIAIKQLGSNGGGFFSANSAHPFENPNPISNFLEMLAILLIPAALIYVFGWMVNDLRQSRVLLCVMLILLVPAIIGEVWFEQQNHPVYQALGMTGGNWEGKETRFGIVNSALWTIVTTGTSNGSVNSMLDSYTPLGGLLPLWMMNLGEIVFGGVGSGLYSMLLLVVITVFIGGLMIGRTPEYLGKKIAALEMKLAAFALLLMPVGVLTSTAAAALLPSSIQGLANPGAHGLSEILYAMSSMTNNNGSAFAGLQADHPFYLILGALLMLIGRFGVAIPIMALSGTLVVKQRLPAGTGTLATHTPTFTVLLFAVILLLGALAFLPVLALGPIVEHMLQGGMYVP